MQPMPSCPARLVAQAAPAGLAYLANNRRYLCPPHVLLLSEALRKLAIGEIKRLIVTMPPRHGKSELVSKTFPAWYLGHFPDHRVILTSYEAEFAASWGYKAREIMEQHGADTFGLRVRQDSRAKNRWNIEGHSGGMITAGVGGAVTGWGADLLIADDPVKNSEQAFSDVYREKTWDWWRSTAFTRLEPNGKAIVMQTRWHEDDLAGKIIQEMEDGGEHWTIINLPAIAEDDDALGRLPGEALWPERYSTQRLEQIKEAVGSYVWSALYQQRPAPAEGGLFKRSWLRYYTRQENGYRLDDQAVTHAGLVIFATVDLAISERTTADPTVIATWGLTPNRRLLLLDLHRERMEGPSVIPAIKASYAKHKHSVIYMETDGFQKTMIQQARRDTGLPVREIRTKGENKISRAMFATAKFEAEQIWLPASAPWLAEYERELMSFPTGKHDDQVDVTSYATLQMEEIGGGSMPPSMGLRRPNPSVKYKAPSLIKPAW